MQGSQCWESSTISELLLSSCQFSTLKFWFQQEDESCSQRNPLSEPSHSWRKEIILISQAGELLSAKENEINSVQIILWQSVKLHVRDNYFLESFLLNDWSVFVCIRHHFSRNSLNYYIYPLCGCKRDAFILAKWSCKRGKEQQGPKACCLNCILSKL